MCVFFWSSLTPTNPKHLFLIRFGIGAFQKGSGPELLFFSPMGSVQNRCVFWVGPSLTPINAKQLFLNRFGIDAFQKGSRSPFFPRWVLFKTGLCFFGTSPDPNQSETTPFDSLRPRCFPKGFRAGVFFCVFLLVDSGWSSKGPRDVPEVMLRKSFASTKATFQAIKLPDRQ